MPIYQVDECQKQSENAENLLQLQNAVTGIPDQFKILSPARRIIRHDTAQEYDISENGGKILAVRHIFTNYASSTCLCLDCLYMG